MAGPTLRVEKVVGVKEVAMINDNQLASLSNMLGVVMFVLVVMVSVCWRPMHFAAQGARACGCVSFAAPVSSRLTSLCVRCVLCWGLWARALCVRGFVAAVSLRHSPIEVGLEGFALSTQHQTLYAAEHMRRRGLG